MASDHVAESRRNGLLAALTPEDYSLLAPHLKELSLKVGSLLQEAGEPIENIYFPHQGMISLLAMMSDGQGIETATVGSEGVVGALSGFGIIRRGFARAVVQAPLVASRPPPSSPLHPASRMSRPDPQRLSPGVVSPRLRPRPPDRGGTIGVLTKCLAPNDFAAVEQGNAKRRILSCSVS
jgi:hypothetical protein